MFKSKGFTLIEIVIVVLIIGVLGTALTTKIISMRERAADTKRLIDVRQLGIGLNLYYMDNNSYPKQNVSGTDEWEVSTSQTWLEALLGKYMSDIPRDPKNIFGPNPWIIGNKRTAKMYAYYNYSEQDNKSIYECQLGNYVIIGATQLESAKAYPFTRCPGYDRGSVLDYGFLLQGGDFYRGYGVATGSTSSGENYSIIVGTGSTPITPIITLLDCKPNANNSEVGTTESCNCSAADTQAGGNIWGVGEYRANSKLCKAAVHAGAITNEGGKISYIVTPGRTKYAQGVANGISSKPYSKGGKSIKFLIP